MNGWDVGSVTDRKRFRTRRDAAKKRQLICRRCFSGGSALIILLWTMNWGSAQIESGKSDARAVSGPLLELTGSTPSYIIFRGPYVPIDQPDDDSELTALPEEPEDEDAPSPLVNSEGEREIDSMNYATTSDIADKSGEKILVDDVSKIPDEVGEEPVEYVPPPDPEVEHPTIKFGVHTRGYQNWKAKISIYEIGDGSTATLTSLVKTYTTSNTTVTWDEIFGKNLPPSGFYAYDIELVGAYDASKPAGADKMVGLPGQYGGTVRFVAGVGLDKLQLIPQSEDTIACEDYLVKTRVVKSHQTSVSLGRITVDVVNPQFTKVETVALKETVGGWWEGHVHIVVDEWWKMGTWTVIADARTKATAEEPDGKVVPS